MLDLKRLFFLASLLLGVVWGYSQDHRCAAQAFGMLRSSISPAQHQAAFQSWLERQQAQPDFRNDEVLTIPIIIHVIHNGELVGNGDNLSVEQVYSQIEVLNEDFRRIPGTPGFNESEVGADTRIEFCPATVDPDGTPLVDPGIHRVHWRDFVGSPPPFELANIQDSLMRNIFWSPSDYLNIYTVPSIKDRGVNNILGFASYPNSSTLQGIPGFNGPDYSDGVVISSDAFGRVGNLRRSYNQGRTTTHEVGHWLGLIHIWGDLNNTCEDDDFCADTPPAETFNTGCPEEVISCGGPRMLSNYLDYTDDRCMNIFTLCQASRMRTVMENAPRRQELLNSTACRQVAPLPAFAPNVSEICAGNPVIFVDQSSQDPTAWDWEFPGGTAFNTDDSVVKVIYDQPGFYSVTLTVSNAQGSRSLTRDSLIRVIPPGETMLFQEDFENGLDQWSIVNPDENITWKLNQPAYSPSGRFSAEINYYDYLAGGERDELVAPVFDLSFYQNLELSFEYAYRPANFGSRDSLQVWVSLDSGQSYPYRIFPPADLGPRDFATGEKLDDAFDPQAEEDWCLAGEVGGSCPTIDLSLFAGEPAFRFKFVGICGSDNNIYIDNVSLIADCQAEAIERLPLQQFFDFTVAPTPSTGTFVLKFSLDESAQIQVRGYNAIGKEVFFEEELSAFGPQTRALDWSYMVPGLYFIEVRKDNQSVGRKPLMLRAQ